MKCLYYTKIYCYLIFISCGTSINTKNHINKDKNTVKEELKRNEDDSLKTHSIINCNQIEFVIDFIDYQKHEELANCLSEVLKSENAQGEINYMKCINSLRNMEENNYFFMIFLGIEVKGVKIFQFLLTKSNSFIGCYRDYTLNENGSTRSIHSLYYSCLENMIKSIDSMPVQDYLNKHFPGNNERARQEDIDKCQESLYREYFEAIKSAYKEGKIVLKKYGEE